MYTWVLARKMHAPMVVFHLPPIHMRQYYSYEQPTFSAHALLSGVPSWAPAIHQKMFAPAFDLGVGPSSIDEFLQ